MFHVCTYARSILHISGMFDGISHFGWKMAMSFGVCQEVSFNVLPECGHLELVHHRVTKSTKRKDLTLLQKKVGQQSCGLPSWEWNDYIWGSGNHEHPSSFKSAGKCYVLHFLFQFYMCRHDWCMSCHLGKRVTNASVPCIIIASYLIMTSHPMKVDGLARFDLKSFRLSFASAFHFSKANW